MHVLVGRRIHGPGDPQIAAGGGRLHAHIYFSRHDILIFSAVRLVVVRLLFVWRRCYHCWASLPSFIVCLIHTGVSGGTRDFFGGGERYFDPLPPITVSERYSSNNR